MIIIIVFNVISQHQYVPKMLFKLVQWDISNQLLWEELTFNAVNVQEVM